MRAAVTALLVFALAACKPHPAGGPTGAWQAAGAVSGPSPELVAVPLPPLSTSIFPCQDCHADRKPDLERRELENHEEIVLRHGGSERWCFDCHDPDDRDQLRLVGGERVPLAEAHRLCGQCHGERFRDWSLGLHGKRIGSWSGARQYLLCPACHDAHAPRVAPIVPMPAPPRPERLGARR